MSTTYEIKGRCPGALAPMSSGDGLIVRIKPRPGALPVAVLSLLAEAAAKYGNGIIELTRRANVQLRGVREDTFEPLITALRELDLIDDHPAVEAVRNIMINPLAGIDPTELIDMRPIAAELIERLAEDPPTLPAKFAFMLDGGGRLSLSSIRADIRLLAQPGAEIRVELRGEPLSTTDAAGASRMAVELAHALSLSPAVAGERVGVRGSRLLDGGQTDASASQAGGGQVERVSAPHPDPLPVPLRSTGRGNERLGPLDLGGVCVLGIGVPFGQLSAEQLAGLTRVLATAHIDEVRLSPWRALYVQAEDQERASALSYELCAIGFIVDDSDPLARADACSGAPACSSAHMPAREHARRLAPLLAACKPGATLHVSGCAKGCARSSRADLTLVGVPNGYDVIIDGTTTAAPRARISGDSIAAALGHLAGAAP